MKRWTILIAAFIFVSSALTGVNETVIFDFSEADGGLPTAGVISDSSGNLYGTTEAGGDGVGTVFELSHANGSWAQTVIYSFNFEGGGYFPIGGLVLDAAGDLYGTTTAGGANSGGVVFELSPANGGWTENDIYSFTDDSGYDPQAALIFDKSGNLYGSSQQGGAFGYGTVFELSPSNGSWTETTLHSFDSADGDGLEPDCALVFDGSGNLYGTTSFGGKYDLGIAFELSYSHGIWNETIIHSFAYSDGASPFAGMIFDAKGNLYGTTISGGKAGDGTVFELTSSNGGWTESTLYNFCSVSDCTDGTTPYAGLIFDPQGNLYGTTNGGGTLDNGVVFRLKHSGTGWMESAYRFPGNQLDGGGPYYAGVTLVQGALYGTAVQGGGNTKLCIPNGCGVVYSIAP
jgi:uncharacterized repeat protein (TIGR03803 family)